MNKDEMELLKLYKFYHELSKQYGDIIYQDIVTCLKKELIDVFGRG